MSEVLNNGLPLPWMYTFLIVAIIVSIVNFRTIQFIIQTLHAFANEFNSSYIDDEEAENVVTHNRSIDGSSPLKKVK